MKLDIIFGVIAVLCLIASILIWPGVSTMSISDNSMICSKITLKTEDGEVLREAARCYSPKFNETCISVDKTLSCFR